MYAFRMRYFSGDMYTQSLSHQHRKQHNSHNNNNNIVHHPRNGMRRREAICNLLPGCCWSKKVCAQFAHYYMSVRPVGCHLCVKKYATLIWCKFVSVEQNTQNDTSTNACDACKHCGNAVISCIFNEELRKVSAFEDARKSRALCKKDGFDDDVRMQTMYVQMSTAIECRVHWFVGPNSHTQTHCLWLSRWLAGWCGSTHNRLDFNSFNILVVHGSRPRLKRYTCLNKTILTPA